MAEKFEQWAILELMGHRRLAGLVSEQEAFGTAMCRIDVPQDEGMMMTQFYGGSSIYALTPVSEEVARAFARRNVVRPITVYDLALPAPSSRAPFDDDDIDL